MTTNTLWTFALTSLTCQSFYPIVLQLSNYSFYSTVHAKLYNYIAIWGHKVPTFSHIVFCLIWIPYDKSKGKKILNIHFECFVYRIFTRHIVYNKIKTDYWGKLAGAWIVLWINFLLCHILNYLNFYIQLKHEWENSAVVTMDHLF